MSFFHDGSFLFVVRWTLINIMDGVTNVLNSDIGLTNSNTNRIITFTFRRLPLEKVSQPPYPSVQGSTTTVLL